MNSRTGRFTRQVHSQVLGYKDIANISKRLARNLIQRVVIAELTLAEGQTMYLIFPDSMIIPEVANRREDNHFEDWLTATLIENTNQEQKDPESSLRGITDLWMLEIAERNGKTWMGKFQVQFETGAPGRQGVHWRSDQTTGVLFFSINTDTGEMRFA